MGFKVEENKVVCTEPVLRVEVIEPVAVVPTLRQFEKKSLIYYFVCLRMGSFNSLFTKKEYSQGGVSGIVCLVLSLSLVIVLWQQNHHSSQRP